MADIHVLEVLGKRGDTMQRRFVFHYPIPSEDVISEAAQHPSIVNFVSAVPDICQEELDSIREAETLEAVVDVNYHMDEPILDVVARVKDLYASMMTAQLLTYAKRFEYYLTEITV